MESVSAAHPEVHRERIGEARATDCQANSIAEKFLDPLIPRFNDGAAYLCIVALWDFAG